MVNCTVLTEHTGCFDRIAAHPEQVGRIEVHADHRADSLTQTEQCFRVVNQLHTVVFERNPLDSAIFRQLNKVFPCGNRNLIPLVIQNVLRLGRPRGRDPHRRFITLATDRQAAHHNDLLYSELMIGALVFLGCPLRMVLRMAAGDLNAWVALIGFAGGVATGSFFLKKGFSLGRAYEAKPVGGAVLPVVLAALLVIGVATGAYAVSTEGPGSKHAPIILSLVVALVIGALAQKSRMCFAGSIRDLILMKNFDLISIIAALFAVMAVYNAATGSFHLGFSGQPIAHSQHLWNILGMYVVGFAAVLAGGCPLRQLILAGQGSSDSAVTFLGMLLGAAFAHNFGLVGAAAKAATETEPAVAGGPAAAGKIAVIVCIIVLFVIAGTNVRRKKTAK